MKTLTEQEKLEFYNRFKKDIEETKSSEIQDEVGNVVEIEITDEEWIEGYKKQQDESKKCVITPEEVAIEAVYAERLRKYPPLLDPEH
jgi:hypothetical protein